MLFVFSLITGITLFAVGAFQPPAKADEVDVLKGKTIRVIIGSSGGSTTDTVARSFFDFLREELPATTIRLQNLQGSGGAKAVVELQGAAGSVITVGVFNYGSIYGQLLAADPAPYDLTTLHLIGSLTSGGRVLAVRKDLGVSTFDALLKLERQPVIGANDALATSTLEGLLVNAMTGLRMKVVQGMSDEQAESMLLSGDIDAMVGNLLDFQSKLDSGDLIALLRFSGTGYAKSLDNVPIVSQFVRPDVPEDLTFLMETLNKSGRMIAAAPATDPTVVQALRIAFDNVVANPAFADVMLARSIVVAPTPGVELTERLHRVLGEPSIKQILQAHLDCGRRMSDSGATSCN